MAHVYRTKDGETHVVSVVRKGDRLAITIGERTIEALVTGCAGGHLTFLAEGRSVRAAYARSASGMELWLDGATHHFESTDADGAGSDAGGAGGASDGRVLTPMPGKVVHVNVRVGDAVDAGHPLVVLESMKMQNDITAPAAGTVAAVHHDVGDNVEYGDVLVELELDATEAS